MSEKKKAFYFPLDLQFFAHKKGGGSAATNCSHDSQSKRRGVKKHDGESIKSGGIIVRQLGSKYFPGENTYLSRDFSLHASKTGTIKFYQKKVSNKKKTFVKILSKQ